ncbi:MAG: DUF819 family protein [Bacteroidetes bacterium]|nr:DUF819 family protein [Bacteroidota bacterium]MDA1332874.1 DUF819 family protein [Bacteroidota bacterium]
MITEPNQLFALLAGVLALVFWLSTLPALSKVFRILPPVIWAYFVPMLLTTAGITPSSSGVYSWMSTVLLPFSLFLLMITVDLPSILKLGRKAIIMMLAGTLGIVIGGPIAYLIFGAFLPEDAWQGLATLSGSWIGGTANMLAIKESVGASDAMLGPIIVVDTVVGYGWMGILIFLSAFQERFDKWVKADNGAIEQANARLSELDQTRRPVQLNDLIYIVGLTLVATVVAIAVGDRLPAVGDPTIISPATWAILIVVTVGLSLSFTRLRNLESAGASKIGFLALYLLLTSIGARADLRAVVDAPLFLAAGAVWISVHIALLMIFAKLFRAPLFFVATGSMANIGGAASAPVVASVYHPAMAPVGLLMGVSGYILGIYAALGCAWILGQMAFV